MKTLRVIISVFYLLTAKSAVNAQAFIALEHNGTSVFYTMLDSAITYAQNGDIIYIPGGVYHLNISISKQIHIVGVGHNPDSTTATNITYLAGEVFLLTGAGGGSLTGLYMFDGISFGSSANNDLVSNYSISRCNFNTLGLGSHSGNNVISENVIRSNINLSDASNNAFYNNIINNASGGSQNTFKNNIFLNTIYCGSSLIENNIFIAIPSFHGYGCSPYCCNCGYSIFQNNLFVENITGGYGSFQGVCTTIIGNNQAANNIFVNQSGYIFNYSHDYHLLPDSPGKNAGNDGSDIGIYGGTFPWKEGSVPYNPHIQHKEISGSTDPAGNLNINIQVQAQDH
jgi:hypothetical protein